MAVAHQPREVQHAGGKVGVDGEVRRGRQQRAAAAAARRPQPAWRGAAAPQQRKVRRREQRQAVQLHCHPSPAVATGAVAAAQECKAQLSQRVMLPRQHERGWVVARQQRHGGQRALVGGVLVQQPCAARAALGTARGGQPAAARRGIQLGLGVLHPKKLQFPRFPLSLLLTSWQYSGTLAAAVPSLLRM